MYVAIPVTAAAGLGLPPGAAATGPQCGSVAGLQKMLADLGLYMGSIDGALDADFVAVCNAVAGDLGVPFSEGAAISDAFCGKVASLWEAKFAQPVDISRLAKQRQYVEQISRGLPADQQAQMRCALTGGVWDAATGTCSKPTAPPAPPEDQLTPVEQCLLSGGGWLDGRCVSTEEGVPDQAAITVGEEQGWWDRQETAVKVAVIGGGVLAVAGVVYAATR